MKNKPGTILMASGAALLIAALAFLIYNSIEDSRAGTVAAATLSEVKTVIAENLNKPEPEPEPEPEGPYIIPEPEPPQLEVTEVDGYSYIGYLSIPSLSLELPLMAESDDRHLRNSPCLQTGTPFEGHMVIAGHNYKSHFKNLSKLEPGSAVIFTDMEGNEYTYEAVFTEVIPESEPDAMFTGEYPLTLYTCTYDRTERITVRCTESGSI